MDARSRAQACAGCHAGHCALASLGARPLGSQATLPRSLRLGFVGSARGDSGKGGFGCFAGAAEAPMGLVLGTISLAVAIMELSKAPESPPGFYGFDPLSLKDSEHQLLEGFEPRGSSHN